MGARAIKGEVLALLSTEEGNALVERLDAFDPRALVNVLFTAICSLDPRPRWRGIEMMGHTVARLAASDLEAGRVIMRRLLWSLNDESGGIGWGAPEALAECLCAEPRLAKEYVHMLLSYMQEDGEEPHQDGNFLEHEVLQRGLLWAVARVAQCRPDLLADRRVEHDILVYLASPDSEVRGMAALVCARLPMQAAQGLLLGLQAEKTAFLLYDRGALQTVTVGQIAGQALAALTIPTQS